MRRPRELLDHLVASTSKSERNELVLSLRGWKREALARELSTHPARWHSYDAHPWRHPWLTPANLEAMRTFSQAIRAEAKRAAAACDPRQLHFGFVGNIANCLYVRAVPLRKNGLQVTQFLHPQDRFVMSQPGWEESGSILADEETDFTKLRERGFELPEVADVVQTGQDTRFGLLHQTVAGEGRGAARRALTKYPFIDAADLLTYTSFYSTLPTLERLQEMDALLATQAVQLAYLSGRPYLAAQSGGDLWFEASRADALGSIQRRAFSAANAVLASNPWTFANARRLGLRNVIYLPFMLDDEVYSPGPGHLRKEWTERSGGSFFVLVTSRLDRETKGSQTALEGFRSFSAKSPQARLVLIDWGRARNAILDQMRSLELGDKIVVLPPSGKKRLIEYYRSADCALDQFVVGYFGATGLEAMACGLPVIMRLESAQYESLCETGAPPLLHAERPGEVATHLQTLARSAGYALSTGRAMRSWFMANHASTRWASAYTNLLTATAIGYRFRYDESPLTSSLSVEERRYHANGLSNAPPFPTYRVG
jgi:glycosyltransferase involved in cell wall biosynthesis